MAKLRKTIRNVRVGWIS